MTSPTRKPFKDFATGVLLDGKQAPRTGARRTNSQGDPEMGGREGGSWIPPTDLWNHYSEEEDDPTFG